MLLNVCLLLYSRPVHGATDKNNYSVLCVHVAPDYTEQETGINDETSLTLQELSVVLPVFSQPITTSMNTAHNHDFT